MLRFVPNKIGLWLTTSLVVIGVLFYAVSSFLLQDQVLTMQFRNNLQKSLKKTGLKIEIGNIHWSGWGSFKCSKVSLIDTKQKLIPVKAEQLMLSFDLLTLLRNRRHPESALRKVEMIEASIGLKRFSDGTWDIQKYFPKSNRKLRLDTVFIVKNGTFELDDELYGKHSFTQINGKSRFYQDNTFDWEFQGISDFNKNCRWSSRGDTTTNFKTGHAELSVANLLLPKVAPYLPEPYSVKVYKGTGDIDLMFGWDNGKFWFKNGAISLSDTRLQIPNFDEILDIKELSGTLSPSGLKITKAQVSYDESLFKLSGQLDTKTAAVQGTISGDRVRLADLEEFFPVLQPYKIEGLANFRVVLGGTIDEPLLNGELFLNGVGVDLKKDLRIEEISGQAIINENNLQIKRMEGFFGKALVGVEGKINNIFAPNFDLKLFGVGLDPSGLGLPEFAGLKLGSKIDFDGKVSGELWSPLLSGEFQIDRLEFQEMSAENLRVTIGWDVMAKDIRISKLAGEIGEGSLVAEGTVKINAGGVEWKISGDLTDLELGRTKFGSEMGVNGKFSTHAILKGKWKQGEPFNPGLILGTFKGDGFTNQEVRLKDIQGVYSWKENKLIVESIQASTGQGRIYGHLAWDTEVITANFNAEHIPIRDLLPDVKKYPFDGVIDGSFEFEGPLIDLSGKIQASIKQASYLSKPVGEITGSFEYVDQGLKIVSLQVASDSGDYSIRGGIDWATEPMVSMRVSSDNLKLGGFRQWLPLDPSLQLGGAGTLNLEISGPIANPAYYGVIHLDSPRLGILKMEQGMIQLEGDFQEIHLNKMELNDDVSSIVVSGKASREVLNLNLTGSQIDLGLLGWEYDGKRLQGRLDLKGKLDGNPSNPILSLEISPSSLIFGPFSGAVSSGNIVWKEKEIQLSRIKLGGDDFKLNIYGKVDISQPITVDLGFNINDLSLAKLSQFFNVTQIEATGKLNGLVKVTGNPVQPKIRVNGELSNAALSSIPLQGEFELDYHQNRLTIEQLKLRQNLGNLVASGIWEANSALNLQIKATGFSLETFNSFLSPAHQLAGTIDIDTNLAWSSSKISGELQANIDEFYLNQNRLGDLQLRGSFTERGFSINESLLDTKGGSITALGHLPWPDQILSKVINFNASSSGLDLKLVFKNTPLGITNSYLPKDIRVTSGSINGELDLEGAYGRPLLSGKLEADHIGVGTSLLPLPVEKVQMSLEVDDNKVLIRQARGEYGDGKFTLNGETRLFGEEDQLNFALNFIGSNLYYRNNYFDGYSNLNLELTGTNNYPKLTGEIHISEAKIGMLKMAKNSAPSASWNPSFDLRVTTGKNVRYRQVGLADIAVRGDLRVGGDLKNPLISGEASSNKGVLTLYGQTFKINKAKAVFKYSEGFYPYVDIDSSVMTAEAEVFLIVKGQIGGDLSIKLNSYPSLSEEDLFALLNWSELRGDKPLSVEGVANTNLSFVTDTMFGEVFYELRQALHLDYLYLERDFNEDEFWINAGDYVSSGLFLSYSRSVSDPPKEKWGLDYHLTSNLIAGGTYSIEEGTSWRLTYRFRF